MKCRCGHSAKAHLPAGPCCATGCRCPGFMVATQQLASRPAGERLALLVGSYFVDSWALMLGLGILHHHAHGVPALGYFLTMLLLFLMWETTLVRTPAANALNMKQLRKK